MIIDKYVVYYYNSRHKCVYLNSLYIYKIILVEDREFPSVNAHMFVIGMSKMVQVSQRTDYKSKICNTLT